jgi:hypothetical protein
MRDSYERFFDHFNIDLKDLLEFGVKSDTIYPDPLAIRSEWKTLVEAVTDNREVFIRGYGRDAHGTHLYIGLYRILLGNMNVRKDKTNNRKPTQLLQRITGYSKSSIKDNRTKKAISNYQVTHIFDQTKNPFLFVAPWNLVWKPKILDPFTGHESKGAFSQTYKTVFRSKAKLLYADYIEEYNDLASFYFSPEKVNNALDQIGETIHIDQKAFEKFAIDVKKELSLIS